MLKGPYMNKLSFEYPAAVVVSLPELVINLSLCILASFILRYVFITRSVSLSGKFHVSTTIPILACVTFLVIMVVKSSLALSLGLVGALSVIRFRTPIKEPEELAYLFLAIALGLGYGAGQTIVTTIVFFVILALITLWLSRTNITRHDEYNLLLEWTNQDLDVSSFTKRMQDELDMVDIHKYNSGPLGSSLYARVSVDDMQKLQSVVKGMREISPDVSCSFYEARPLQ